MFSNGAPRHPDHDRPFVKLGALSGRRVRAWAATGISALVLAGLAVPSPAAAADGTSTTALLANWAATSDVSVVQDNSSALTYSGSWIIATHSAYMDGRVRSTDASGAKVSLSFTGTAIAWTGPVGPTRGTAGVYIDGTLAATVSTWSSSFSASRVLFTKTWSTAGTHRISIITSGTAGPTVALDAFLVRDGPTPSTEAPAAVIETPAPTPAPTATPMSSTSVRVTTIPALLTALADNTVTDIVVANGTYRVGTASSQGTSSLWIGSRFAGRTRAVTVRAETRGKVTFDGGGASYFGGLTFVDGAHHQTWDGFNFANGKPTQTGVIVFGGYGLASPHHITLRHITMLPSIVAATANNDHLIYFSKDSPHDILIEDYTATPGAGIKSALQFYHGPNAYNLTVRRMHVVGTQNAILMYERSVHDVLIEDSDIRNAVYALDLATTGANVVFRNVASVNTGGTYFPNGVPSGVSFIGCSFD
jgi:hypothetical protein